MGHTGLLIGDGPHGTVVRISALIGAILLMDMADITADTGTAITQVLAMPVLITNRTSLTDHAIVYDLHLCVIAQESAQAATMDSEPFQPAAECAMRMR